MISGVGSKSALIVPSPLLVYEHLFHLYYGITKIKILPPSRDHRKNSLTTRE